ncbi:MFS transporter [Cohnella thailandensis]|uniref:MFS transporter n=1 Tax=Cohnella thailandensis TaxID=557557 RepID=A0A841SYC7_9BACL|nr:MFS transporter [Cohnella thailandensis]
MTTNQNNSKEGEYILDSKQSLWTRNFFSICFSSFFIFITFYAMTATLPTFVTDELGGNQQQAGWVLTFYVIAAVIMRPFAGRLMDGPGRMKLLLIATALFMVCSFFYPMIAGFGILLVLRFIHGLSFGAATTANGTIVVEYIPANRRGEGMGYYTLAMNLAMVLGPFMGLLLIQNASFDLFFYVLMVLCVLGMILAVVVSRSRRDRADAKPAQAANEVKAAGQKPRFSWRSYIEPKAIPISFVAMFLSMAYASILSFVPSFAKEIGLESYSSYYFIVYAVMIVAVRPFTGKIFDRLHRNYIVYPTLLLYVIGLIVLATAHSGFMFLLSAAIIGLGFGSLSPCLQTIAIQMAPREKVGLATGTYFIFFDGGVGIGSAVLGSIAAATNNRVMYLCSMVSVLLGAIVYFWLMHRRPSHQAEAADAA